jgi:hypothetical protein
MEGQLKQIKMVFHSGNRYVIPPYQRQYQWSEERWQSVVCDIGSSLKGSESDPAHWLGVLLLSQERDLQFTGDDSIASFSVIDGQQRIVTLLVWLAALVHHAEDIGEDPGLSISNLSEVSVQVSDKKSLEVVLKKLWLKPQYQSLAESQIVRAYRYFRFVLWLGQDALLEEYPIKLPNWKIDDVEVNVETIWEKYLDSSSSGNIERSEPVDCKSLIEATRKRLTIFMLIHDPRIDEPVATIFDTLNGMRTELEPLDHVRNSIFVRLPRDKSEELFTKHWSPAENTIRDVRIKGLKPGISFLYDFIISQGEKKRQGTISRMKGASHVARMTRDFNEIELENFMRESLIPAMVCWPVVIRKRNSIKFDGLEIHFSERSLELMDSIRDFTKNPANPLVLLYLTARANGEISDKQLEKSLELIESYIARLILSLTPLSPLRARIMDIAGEIDCNISESKLRDVLKKAKWPTDAVIRSEAKRGQYGELDASQLGAIFRGIEKSISGKHAMNFKIGSTAYSVEHIYPRKDVKWHADLKAWKTNSKKMDTYLQVLGNLTIVSKEHNSRVGNSRLKDKQKYPTLPGRAAPLGIHKGWVKSEKWTEVEIQQRTDDLIAHALKHWKIPK